MTGPSSNNPEPVPYTVGAEIDSSCRSSEEIARPTVISVEGSLETLEEMHKLSPILQKAASSGPLIVDLSSCTKVSDVAVGVFSYPSRLLYECHRKDLLIVIKDLEMLEFFTLRGLGRSFVLYTSIEDAVADNRENRIKNAVTKEHR